MVKGCETASSQSCCSSTLHLSYLAAVFNANTLCHTDAVMLMSIYIAHFSCCFTCRTFQHANVIYNIIRFCVGAINLASGKPVETDQEKEKEKTGETPGKPITR